MTRKMNQYEYDVLKNKLNILYDEMEEYDKQIDLLILKRNGIKTKIEYGVAIMIKYGKEFHNED